MLAATVKQFWLAGYQCFFCMLFTMQTLNTCCIIPKVHPASVREGIFAGVVSEHQHLVNLINFKTVWQTQCNNNSGLLLNQGTLSMFTM